MKRINTPASGGYSKSVQNQATNTEQKGSFWGTKNKVVDSATQRRAMMVSSGMGIPKHKNLDYRSARNSWKEAGGHFKRAFQELGGAISAELRGAKAEGKKTWMETKQDVKKGASWINGQGRRFYNAHIKKFDEGSDKLGREWASSAKAKLAECFKRHIPEIKIIDSNNNEVHLLVEGKVRIAGKVVVKGEEVVLPKEQGRSAGDVVVVKGEATIIHKPLPSTPQRPAKPQSEEEPPPVPQRSAPPPPIPPRPTPAGPAAESAADAL